MNIDKLTDSDLAKLRSLLGQDASISVAKVATAFKIGKTYLIRTVTMIDTGIVQSVNDHEVVLTSAAWIADTGRFGAALKNAEFSEVEPFPDGEVIVGRGAIIDAVEIGSPPRLTK